MRIRPERIPTLPGPVRAVLRNAVWTFGRATAPARPLPTFLVLGAQKAGTTALFAYLREHPQVTGPAWKEVSFFDRHYVRGPRWYRGNFPLRGRAAAAVGEASPGYLFHPLAPQRVRGLLPEARLVALLREPADRALSHYHHQVALGREALPFEEALEQEEERLAGELERLSADPAYFSYAWWNQTYVSRGLYAQQLERWLAVFPREQLLVLLTDELAADPGGTYRRVLEFLHVAPHELASYPRVFEREYEGMSADTRRRLKARFAEPNRRLAELLGRELPWS